MKQSASSYNVVKVGSRFHLICDGHIFSVYWTTREEAEKECDKTNDIIWENQQKS
jgi:hypothetical protein